MIGTGRRWTASLVVLAALLVAGFATVASDCAFANDCAERCFAQENACRRDNKGAQSCDAALTRCLQACRAQR